MSNLVITQRDRKLLARVSDFGLLSTRQIEAMVFSGVASTTVLRRLRRLEEAGYLRRVPEIRAHVWTLGARNPLPYELQTYGIINRNTLAHDVTVSDVRWALEKAGLGAAWKSGHVLRKEAGATYSKSRGAVDAIPDGLIGIPVQGSYRGVALEVELHAKGRHRYRKVFESYRSKKNIWKIWYVVAHQKLGQQIIGISTPLYWDRAPGFVVYSLIDELVRDPFTARAVSSQGSVLVPEIFPITSVPPAHSPAHPLSGYASIAKSIDEDNTLALQEKFNGSHAPETGARLTYRGGLRGSLVAESLLEETKSDSESEVSHGA